MVQDRFGCLSASFAAVSSESGATPELVRAQAAREIS